MSNKTRLQTNNTNLQALIDKANALPDAGSGSGGNVNTCTVKIINQITTLGHYIHGLGYTYMDTTGQITTAYTDYGYAANQSTEVVLENVICGSYIRLSNYGYNYVGYTYAGGLTELDNVDPGQNLAAPTEAGATGILYIEDWD